MFWCTLPTNHEDDFNCAFPEATEALQTPSRPSQPALPYLESPLPTPQTKLCCTDIVSLMKTESLVTIKIFQPHFYLSWFKKQRNTIFKAQPHGFRHKKSLTVNRIQLTCLNPTDFQGV